MDRFFLAAIVLLAPVWAQGPVRSPNGAIEFSFTQPSMGPNAGWLCYQVTYRGNPVIRESRLGLKPQGQGNLGEKLKVTKTETGQIDESYRMPHGRAREARAQANSGLWSFEETVGLKRRLNVEVRVFNDGVGFRYLLPRQDDTAVWDLERELTQFTLAKDGTTWGLPLNGFRTSYEDSYSVVPLTSQKRESIFALPFTAEVPGVAWVSITESALENWAGLYLQRTAGRTLDARLAQRIDTPEIAVKAALPAQSPWRVIMIAPQAAALLSSNLVNHLAPRSRIQDESWIRPGKTSWSWWSGDHATGVAFKPGMNTATMKHYIDFSAANGIEYMMLDEGWSADVNGKSRDLTKTNPELDLPEILRYAKAKNVGIWLWAYWTFVDVQMNEAFPLFEKWGVKGVKVDFMDRDDQEMVAWYHRVAKKAAEHKLLIDFHGAFKPAGMMRYYPNVLTHEGAMSNEYLKWSNRVDAAHNTILPFTRGLAGPMDYTPGGFVNVTPESFEPRWLSPMVPTTRAHQLALYVLYESGFQMLCDYPEAYQGQPEFAFIKAVPVAWDESRGLGGRPGEWASVARRNGQTWWVGTIAGREARDVELPLEFLGEGNWVAETYTDVPGQPGKSERTATPVTRATRLKVKLAATGGHAMSIRRP